MDSAKTDPDSGTYWAPEDRAWLWYNDTIETHAFALRDADGARARGLPAARPGAVAASQQEAQPVEVDARDGRGHLRPRPVPQEGGRARGAGGRHGRGREPEDDVRLRARPVHRQAQPGRRARRKDRSEAGRRDRRVEDRQGPRVRLRDLALLDREAAGGGPRRLLLGLTAATSCASDRPRASCSSRSPRAPSCAPATRSRCRSHSAPSTPPSTSTCGIRAPPGSSPRTSVSRYKWDLGIAWYEETRDSGANFFFEWLPVGEYTFKYRIRANMAGTFKVSGRRRCSRCTRRSSTPTRRGRR